MTWTQRLRLFGGILAVLALTAVLTLVFNQRQAQALSTTGQVVSAQASVGAAYGGVVTKTDVKRRRRGEEGPDPLHRQQPATCSGTSRRASRSPRTDAFDVDTKASTVTYKALSDGRLSDVKAQTGGFVQNGANLATITVGRLAVCARRLRPLAARLRADRQGRAPSACGCPTTAPVEGTVQSVSVTDRERPGQDAGDRRQRLAARTRRSPS